MEKKVFEAGHRKQKCGVCVITSYAAAVSPHLPGANVGQFLEAYCREYKRDFASQDEAERLVASHFDQDCRAAGRSGYDHLATLHREGEDAVFRAAARATTITELPSPNPFQMMLTNLRAKPGSTAVLCLLPEKEPAHSVAVTFDSSTNRFLVSDPNEDFVAECELPEWSDKVTQTLIKTGTILLVEPKVYRVPTADSIRCV